VPTTAVTSHCFCSLLDCGFPVGVSLAVIAAARDRAIHDSALFAHKHKCKFMTVL
jgi:hypothetical protein